MVEGREIQRLISNPPHLFLDGQGVRVNLTLIDITGGGSE